MDKENGGPAFPVTYLHEHIDGSTVSQEWGGMTLRDYFAVHAPAVPDDFERKSGIADIVKFAGGLTKLTTRKENDAERLVRWRWQYADLMIKARES